eukprot:4106375-Prymnesium_polylepis.1
MSLSCQETARRSHELFSACAHVASLRLGARLGDTVQVGVHDELGPKRESMLNMWLVGYFGRLSRWTEFVSRLEPSFVIVNLDVLHVSRYVATVADALRR